MGRACLIRLGLKGLKRLSLTTPPKKISSSQQTARDLQSPPVMWNDFPTCQKMSALSHYWNAKRFTVTCFSNWACRWMNQVLLFAELVSGELCVFRQCYARCLPQNCTHLCPSRDNFKMHCPFLPKTVSPIQKRRLEINHRKHYCLCGYSASSRVFYERTWLTKVTDKVSPQTNLPFTKTKLYAD